MKRLLTLVAFFATVHASAQQVNPVPDYVFRNQMSVGRNAVTDTAAYFSIGPRYGAVKGFMPPIVGDTATFSSGKRNGLLIFSVQKNKFLYWDSVRVQWSDMAGSSGAYIVAGDTSAMLAPYLRKADTSSMLANYIRHAGYGLTKSGQSFLVDTLNIATRAWRQKGLDSLAALEVSGSGTTNYVPKFTASGTIGNSQIFDNGTNVGIGTTSPTAKLTVVGAGAQTILNSGTTADARMEFHYNSGREGFISWDTDNLRLQADAGNYLTFFSNATERVRISSGGNVGVGTNNPVQKFVVSNSGSEGFEFVPGASSNSNQLLSYNRGTSAYSDLVTRAATYNIQIGTTNAAYIFANGRVGINTTTDAGYQLDINGTLRSVNGANFATTSGNVLIGTATASTNGLLQVNGNIGLSANSQVRQSTNADGGTLQFFGTQFVASNLNSNSYGYTGGAFMASVTNNDNLTPLEAGRIAATGGKFKIVNTTSENTYISLEKNSVTTLYANTSNGNVGIGTASVTGKMQIQGAQQDAAQTIIRMAANNASAQIKALDFQINAGSSLFVFNTAYAGSAMGIDFADAGTSRMRVTADGEVFVNTTSDAGDYKLQVVGNARVGTGKLDIASNTTFGLGVARSGTSEVAGQIYNSNGILYFGAESSTGGQIFSGSSAYAGVIGTGANYPLQFAVNNITRGGFSTSGNLLLGFTTDSYFLKLQVNGSIFSNNQFFGQGANAQLSIDSSTNISPLYVSAHSLTGTSAQAMLYSNTTWNTTGNPSLLDLNITNTASGATSNYIKITDGTNTFRVTKAAEVVTAAPTGGSIRKWKLGEAATVSPTSPNRTIRVEIDGTVYYLHAKTTND